MHVVTGSTLLLTRLLNNIFEISILPNVTDDGWRQRPCLVLKLSKDSPWPDVAGIFLLCQSD